MDDDEASSVLNRLKRYVGVATGVTGVALRGAGRWIGGKGPLDTGNAADLARMLGGLRGPLMKGAQIAGSLPDVFPPAFAAELAKLQSNAPEMGASFVRRRMAAELGPAWQTKFKSFDLKAAHAASLGQVHRAVALDGRALACKLQYPDMQSTVDADLTQLKTILSLQRAAERKFDTRDIAVEVEERIREELDYVREAAHMRLFGHMFQGDDRIAVPEPMAALSTGRLLTMTWLDGAPFRDALARPQAERDAIAKTLYRAWFVPLFQLRRRARRRPLRQLHRPRRRRDQPFGLRLRAHLPGARGARPRRSPPRPVAQRRRARREGLHGLGLHRRDRRLRRQDERVGKARLRRDAGGSRPPARRRNLAHRRRRADLGDEAALPRRRRRSARRASSSSSPARSSASAPPSSTSTPNSTGTACTRT